jgi:hypothetical protein
MKRAGAAMLLLVFTGSISPALSRELSDPQRQRLERGEVVVLDLLPPGGSPEAVQGGTALGVVHAPPADVWRMLVDYPRHAELYPRVTSSEVLEAHPGHALVRYVVGVGLLSFGFHVDNYPDAARRRLDWRLADSRRNQLFRRSWGYWQVDGRPDGALLTYAMAAETVLPAFLTRRAERDGLVDTVRAVRDRAERRS